MLYKYNWKTLTWVTANNLVGFFSFKSFYLNPVKKIIIWSLCTQCYKPVQLFCIHAQLLQLFALQSLVWSLLRATCSLPFIPNEHWPPFYTSGLWLQRTPLPSCGQKVKSTALDRRSSSRGFTCSSCHSPTPSIKLHHTYLICPLVTIISKGWNSWLQRVNWRHEMREESEPWLMGRIMNKYRHTHTHTQMCACAQKHMHTHVHRVLYQAHLSLLQNNASAFSWDAEMSLQSLDSTTAYNGCNCMAFRQRKNPSMLKKRT